MLSLAPIAEPRERATHRHTNSPTLRVTKEETQLQTSRSPQDYEMEDAAVIDVVINPRARPVIEKAGHGSSWLAELEELLSHDEWDPVDGREALWNEVRAFC